jgi:hypothetical protein
VLAPGTPPALAGDSLVAVSCATATSCFAVGTAGTPQRPLIEHWNGTTWTKTTNPNPAGSTSSALVGVSCVSATTTCFATGFAQFSAAPHRRPMVERGNGTSWSLGTAPPATGADSSELHGVSCPTTTFCFAVGVNNSSDTASSLIERWNGTAWAIVASPQTVNGSFDLARISCSSAFFCIAVGTYDFIDFDVTLLDKWNGSAWTNVPSIPGGGGQFSGFFDVACTSGTSCDAVGDTTGPDPSVPFIAHYDGTDWTEVISPDFPRTAPALLLGIACPAAGNCHAVGSIDHRADRTTMNTLAEHFS